MVNQAFLLRAPILDQGAGPRSLAADAVPCSVEDKLRTLSTLLQYRPREKIFSQGEEAQFVYFVGTGLLRIFRIQGQGHRQIVRFSSDGDIFGFPHKGHYVNSAEPVYSSLIYRLPWKSFRQLMLTTPELQTLVLDKIAAEFRHAEGHLLMLGQQIFCRVAMFLIEMTETRFFDARRQQLTLPINRLDLADYLGTSLETASRAMVKLEEWGIIRRAGTRQIQILDLERLRSLQDGPRRFRNGGERDETPTPFQAAALQ